MPRPYLLRLTSTSTVVTAANIVSVALFIAVLAAWVIVFRARQPDAPALPVAPAAIDTSAGGTLFGAQPDQGNHDQVQLLGILAFDSTHAAAIVSVGGEAAHVVRLHGSIADATTLREVRARSIVVERNGVQREITLPAAQDPSAFIR
jgi:general secretion pathway protein C